MEKALTPGESFEVARLDIEGAFVDVGVMICADREFPESARELMLGGAELILVPNACPMAGERTYQLRSRAFENMTAIATVNYSAPDQDGHSSVFDGMVFEQIVNRMVNLVTNSFSRQAMARTSTLPFSIWTHSGSTEGVRRWETLTGNPARTGA